MRPWKSVESKEFDGMLEDTKRAWSEIWSDLDIKLTGCDEWQGALRYNIFQLIQSTPEGDGRASIGARGLTHGRYKGCYFWDTEIFMLPMLTCMRPGAAAACSSTGIARWTTPSRAPKAFGKGREIFLDVGRHRL